MAGGAHELRDAEKLVLHERIAHHLMEDPSRVIAIAQSNITRWHAAEAVEDVYAAEWQQIIAMSVTDLVQLITADTDEGRRLRQSSPFVGVVTGQERAAAFETARRRWQAVRGQPEDR